MDDRLVFKCELCGSDVMAELAHHIELDGKTYSFCSADHLVEWRELNEAVARRHEPAP